MTSAAVIFSSLASSPTVISSPTLMTRWRLARSSAMRFRRSASVSRLRRGPCFLLYCWDFCLIFCLRLSASRSVTEREDMSSYFSLYLSSSTSSVRVLTVLRSPLVRACTKLGSPLFSFFLKGCEGDGLPVFGLPSGRLSPLPCCAAGLAPGLAGAAPFFSPPLAAGSFFFCAASGCFSSFCSGCSGCAGDSAAGASSSAGGSGRFIAK